MARKLTRILILAVALCCLLAVSAFAADYAVAVVDADQLNFRTEPNTSCDVIEKLDKGAQLLVVLPEEGEETGWYEVVFSDYGTGYISAEYVIFAEQEDGVMGIGQVASGPLNVREAATVESKRLGQVSTGTCLTLTGYEDGWFQISYKDTVSYVSAEYILLSRPMSVSNGTLGSEIAALSQQFIGCRYVYGASGPNSFDCSGFTLYIYRQYGISLAHGATAQMGYGVSVNKSELQPGDLVFFRYNTTKAASHVGIYIGDGKFIHSSTREYLVRVDTLMSGHYSNVYVGARRLV